MKFPPLVLPIYSRKRRGQEQKGRPHRILKPTNFNAEEVAGSPFIQWLRNGWQSPTHIERSKKPQSDEHTWEWDKRSAVDSPKTRLTAIQQMIATKVKVVMHLLTTACLGALANTWEVRDCHLLNFGPKKYRFDIYSYKCHADPWAQTISRRLAVKLRRRKHQIYGVIVQRMKDQVSSGIWE